MSEIADYFNKHGESFDMLESYDRRRLNTVILDLVNEGSLTPLFFYTGNIKADLRKYEIVNDETGDETLSEVKYFNREIKDYLKITDFRVIKELLVDNHNQWVNVADYCDFYKFPFDTEIYKYYFLDINKDFCIDFDDLRFPKSDLDELFNVSDIQKVQADTSDLEKRLETAREIYKTQIAQITQLHGDIGCLTIDNLQQAETIQQQAQTILQLNEALAGKSDTPADDKPLQDNDLLTAIYDDTQTHLYAPELHNAIKVWKQIYHDNLTSQHLTTHSDKFDSAIKQLNLRFANNAPKERLKQVTTPQQQKEKTKSKNS